jgi:hypothetical protein
MIHYGPNSARAEVLNEHKLFLGKRSSGTLKVYRLVSIIHFHQKCVLICIIYCCSCSDGPNRVIITPSTQSYTLKETEHLNQIQCTADCIPVCTMIWSGPNILAGTTSVLNLQNINRNQAGNYQCTASNDISSKTSVVVNVFVKCKYYIRTIM